MLKPPISVDEALLTIEQLDGDALRNRWEKVYGIAPSRRASRDFLLLSLAWHIQAQVNGGLSRETKRQLKLVKARDGKPARPLPHLRVGAHLIREWEGRTHCVTVAEEGFLYEDISYKSLSSIARAITGTRWSGPAFFGLRQESK